MSETLARKSSPCRPPDLVASGARHRTSKASRWRALVLVLVHLAIAAHIGIWLASGKAETLSPIEPSEAERFARDSVINTGFVFFALTIVSTLVLGRWFCGWACHLVALQDACRWLMLKVGITPRPLRSRWMALVPLIAALYLFVWPVVPRWLAGEDLALRGTEFSREGFWDTFPPWIPAVITLVVCGGLAVVFLGSKGFCTYGCPYGAFFGLADKLAPGRIRVTDACSRCGHCTAVCTSNVDVSREVHEYGMVVDPGCMKCFDCVTVCPEDALYFGFGKPALGAQPRVAVQSKPRRGLPRREELVVAAVTAFAYFAASGFNQGSGLLLNVGVATTVAGLALYAVRTFTRDEVAVAGVTLRKAGRTLTAGYGLSATLALGALVMVPYGIVPEWRARRAYRAFMALEGARERWELAAATFGSAAVPDELARRARELASDAASVDARTWVVTQHNAVREAWGHLLGGAPAEALAPLATALAAGEEHALLWTLVGDARTPRGGLPGAEAREAYARALQLDSAYMPAAARLVHAAVGALTRPPGDAAAAADALRRLDGVTFRGEGAPALSAEVAFYRLALGLDPDPAPALAALREASAAAPGDVEVRLKLGSVLAQSGDLPGALAALDAAPGPAADDPRIAAFLAELRAALGPR